MRLKAFFIVFVAVLCTSSSVFSNSAPSAQTSAQTKRESIEVSPPESNKDTHKKEVSNVATINISNNWIWKLLMEVFPYVAGALVVVWQVGKQFENNRKLQREDYKEKLRIKVHQEIMYQITEAEQPIVFPIHQAIQNIDYYRKLVVSSPHMPPPHNRALSIQAEFFSFLKEVNKLGSLLERYEITFPSSRIFRIALSASPSDAQDAFLRFYSLLVKFLPMDIPENHPPLPNGSRLMIPEWRSDEEFTELVELGHKAIIEIDRVFDYIFDLNVEIQNITFSHLFEAEIPIREPLDPNSIVISSKNNNFDKLKRHFEENTDWGKRKNKTEEDVRNSLEGEGT